MSVNQQVTALTAALRANFWKAWEETAVVAPSEPFTTIIPSTTRIENYPNWTPAPSVQEWDGTNDYGTLASYVYSIENKIYRAALMIRVPDLEDDQTGALQAKPKEIAVKLKKFPHREIMKALAAGKTGTYTRRRHGLRGRLRQHQLFRQLAQLRQWQQPVDDRHDRRRGQRQRHGGKYLQPRGGLPRRRHRIAQADDLATAQWPRLPHQRGHGPERRILAGRTGAPFAGGRLTVSGTTPCGFPSPACPTSRNCPPRSPASKLPSAPSSCPRHAPCHSANTSTSRRSSAAPI